MGNPPQAKRYARTYKKNTGHDIMLLFARMGGPTCRQNLKAKTLPEHIRRFPTPAEFGELFRPPTQNFIGTLREYQRVVRRPVLGAAQAGRQRMYIVQIATGTGNTVTAAGIIVQIVVGRSGSPCTLPCRTRFPSGADQKQI